MTEEHGDAVYSLGLLRDVARWSVPVALAAAVLGSALTHDARFGISCVLGAGADIGTLVWALRRTRGLDPHEAISSGPFMRAYLLRIAVKAVLLVAAVLLPAWLDLWGTAAGVLTFDLTLATAGSAAMAWRTFRPHRRAG
jgi:hypothetical protein